MERTQMRRLAAPLLAHPTRNRRGRVTRRELAEYRVVPDGFEPLTNTLRGFGYAIAQRKQDVEEIGPPDLAERHRVE
jgi:hypothetical protein